MPTAVYIAIYRPLDPRDPSHWAIYLDNDRKASVIVQVADDKNGIGYYVEPPIYGKYPERSRHHEINIAVGTIRTADHDEAVAMILETPVDNVSSTWNCQAWAIDALNYLEEQGLFTWSRSGHSATLQRRQYYQ